MNIKMKKAIYNLLCTIIDYRWLIISSVFIAMIFLPMFLLFV